MILRLCWLDEEDDARFADNEDGFTLLPVHTQRADHIAGDYAMFSAGMRGCARENVAGYLAE